MSQLTYDIMTGKKIILQDCHKCTREKQNSGQCYSMCSKLWIDPEPEKKQKGNK